MTYIESHKAKSLKYHGRITIHVPTGLGWGVVSVLLPVLILANYKIIQTNFHFYSAFKIGNF